MHGTPKKGALHATPFLIILRAVYFYTFPVRETISMEKRMPPVFFFP
jgi:hypothetical protein